MGTSSAFTRQDRNGIAILTWDLPGRSMNVLDFEGIAWLETAIAEAQSDPGVRGIVITSGKADFAGGMDLKVIAGMKAAAGDDPAKGIFDGLMRMHRLLRRIEVGPGAAGKARATPAAASSGTGTGTGACAGTVKPVVAALPGTALGIGLELPLACHWRIAADDPAARIGLPEIKVGLFPGAGGTTRLSRQLGLMAAAPILMEGRLHSPAEAKAAGLIDAVVPPAELLQRALDWIDAARPEDLVKPWDRPGWKLPGGGPYHPSGFMTFVGASAMVNGQTLGVYPAARAMLSAIYEGAQVPFDTALRIEARHFTQVLMDPVSGAMIRTLFVGKEALEKGALRPADVPRREVRRLGVLGAGMMGAGIAHVSALAGIGVVLLDATDEAANRGKAGIGALLDKAVSRGKLGAATRDEVLARITPGTDYAALAGCDLVIEAVFEDPAVKAEVTARAEAALGEGAVFASNTSTLPIGLLARASRRPESFLGIHFFSPVDRMGLVEVIRGKQTGDAALALALDYTRQIRKTPILVNDGRFFYANRCIIPYLNEGMRMLAEGVAPALIENAARLFGMPLGPLQLVDEISVELAARIARATRAAMGEAYPDADVDAVVFALEAAGRLGRKTGAGFYDYDAKGKRLGLAPLLAELWPVAAVQPPLAEVQDRLAMAQALAAVQTLDAGVLTDLRSGDVGAILGWGFAPWSGGPFSWLDRLGAAEAVRRCDSLAARHGSRFAAPASLRNQAETGSGFYPA